MAKKEVGIGLIGYAFMGKAHSNAYRQVEKFFPDIAASPAMRAICGRNEENVRRAAEAFGWQGYETDYKELINRDDIDIVDITAPGTNHHIMALEAAKAGKAIFCEKPLGNTLQEAKEMLEAVEKAGVINMVCFNYRRVPAVALAQKMIANGDLGEIHHVRAKYLQDWIVDPNFPLVWRLRKDIAGSGSLGDLGAHSIDMAHFLLGSNITSLTSLTHTFVKQRPLPAETTGSEGLEGFKATDEMGEVTVDDAALFLTRFENGAIGSFEATRFAAGRKNHNTIEVNGSKGSIVFNMERMNELEYYNSGDPEDRRGFRLIQVTEPSQPYAGAYWPAGHIIGYEHTFINSVYDLINGYESKQNPHPDFRAGAQVNAVLDAVEKSAESQKWEDVEQL
jgi:predicted dehydrogenase